MAHQREFTKYQMIVLALLLVTTVPFIAAVVRGMVKTIGYTHPAYTVTIDSIGGLAADLAAPVSPEFKLTFRIDERTGRHTACIGHRPAVAVDYQGAVLARGPVPELCVDENTGAAEAPAAAWGTDIKIPAFMRDQLREELRRGEAAFGVSVRVPSENNGGPDTLFQCRGKVGEESAPCSMTYIASKDHQEIRWYIFT
ncbi:hypothetical protein ZWY2020_016148 [Hordeum vulgare]|nr:hypothetical protein ZWY2020_016148 [Hordeum vulgare]